MAVEKNPWSQLVRMLEMRHGRQKVALADTELQLEGAKKNYADWETQQGALALENSSKPAKR